MVQIFGQFHEFSADTEEYLVIGFSPTSIPLKQRWRNNGLSADFLADYLTVFFPAENEDAMQRALEVKGVASYVANELLENAMKYNDEKSNFSISIKLKLLHDSLIFSVTNSIALDKVEAFQQLIQQLIHHNPDDLYLKQLENTQNNNTHSSGLGLLTMLNDYGADLGWKFEQAQDNPPVMLVTTMVTLKI